MLSFSYETFDANTLNLSGMMDLISNVHTSFRSIRPRRDCTGPWTIRGSVTFHLVRDQETWTIRRSVTLHLVSDQELDQATSILKRHGLPRHKQGIVKLNNIKTELSV